MELIIHILIDKIKRQEIVIDELFHQIDKLHRIDDAIERWRDYDRGRD